MKHQGEKVVCCPFRLLLRKTHLPLKGQAREERGLVPIGLSISTVNVLLKYKGEKDNPFLIRYADKTVEKPDKKGYNILKRSDAQ